MTTTVQQSSFSVSCNPDGNASSQVQVTQTSYYIGGMLVGQSSSSTPLTLSQFQTIVAALEPAS
jgi:hypothetical protein